MLQNMTRLIARLKERNVIYNGVSLVLALWITVGVLMVLNII